MDDFDESVTTDATFPVVHGSSIWLTPHTDDDCQEFVHWSDITDPTDPNYAANPRKFIYEGVAPTFTAVFQTIQINVHVDTETGDDTQGTVVISIP